MVVRGKILALSSFYKKQKTQLVTELHTTIAQLEQQHKATCDPKVYHKLVEERKKLGVLEIHNIRCNLLYIKHKYWMRTPMALKLLAWKVKTQKAQTQVHVIQDRSGVQQTLTTEILEVFKGFYRDLYFSEHPSKPIITDFLDNCGFNTVLT